MSRTFVLHTLAVVTTIATMGVVAFLSAWTLHYWQAWVLLAAMLGSFGVAIMSADARRDSASLEQRTHSGPRVITRTSQRISVFLLSLGWFALLVVPGFDHRFGWSSVPPSISLAADLLVAAGMLITYRVRQEILRSDAAATTEEAQGRRMISTGPFAVVRHPMQAGVLLYQAAMPVALGSWWGLVVFAVMLPLIVVRVFDEEKILRQAASDYSDYTQKVEYRLLPHVW